MKILLATDGSKNALRAVRHAARLAADLKSETSITLISVHDATALLLSDWFAGVG
ncbi:MAG: universal stress protein, partial [Betaproteobacteria bacterium]